MTVTRLVQDEDMHPTPAGVSATPSSSAEVGVPHVRWVKPIPKMEVAPRIRKCISIKEYYTRKQEVHHSVCDSTHSVLATSSASQGPGQGSGQSNLVSSIFDDPDAVIPEEYDEDEL